MSNVLRYNSKALFISTGDIYSNQLVSGALTQISRVQDLGTSINYPIVEEEYLESANEKILSSSPSINLSLNWLLTNGGNERAIGFITNGTTGAFLNLNQQKNIYITTEDNNIDAVNVNRSGAKYVIGLGNSLLSSYNLSASVGAFPTASASFDALKAIAYESGINQLVPSVDQNGIGINNYFNIYTAESQTDDYSPNSANSITALRPKDIILEFSNGNPFGVDIKNLALQSFEVDISFQRTDARGMGDKFPGQRPLLYPINIAVTTEAIIPSYLYNQMSDNCLGTGTSINLLIKQPCSDLLAFELNLRGMNLESQADNVSINGFEKVTLQWKTAISNPLDLKNNLFMKSYQGDIVYELVETIPVTGYDINGILYYDEESIYERKLAQNNYVYSLI